MNEEIFNSIGNLNRAKILACLEQQDKTVTELINNCKVSQSAVSQHLAYLKTAGLISAERKGKFQIYRSNNKKLSAICRELLSI